MRRFFRLLRSRSRFTAPSILSIAVFCTSGQISAISTIKPTPRIAITHAAALLIFIGSPLRLLSLLSLVCYEATAHNAHGQSSYSSSQSRRFRLRLHIFFHLTWVLHLRPGQCPNPPGRSAQKNRSKEEKSAASACLTGLSCDVPQFPTRAPKEVGLVIALDFVLTYWLRS